HTRSYGDWSSDVCSSDLDCRVTRQNFGIHIAQDHVRGAAIVPRQHSRPDLNLVIKQGTQINRRKMSEIENLHRAPEGRLQKRLAANWSVLLRARRRQTGGHGKATSALSPAHAHCSGMRFETE